MVRFFLIVTILTTLLSASALQDKIKSFIGDKEYKVQKNLIKVLFKNESKFVDEDGKVDDIKVLKELKNSGLLKLFYNRPKNLYLSFFSKDDSVIFLRVINESLSLMGYNYFLTKKAVKSEDGFLWQIVISTEHIVDPLILAKRLEKRGYKPKKVLENVQAEILDVCLCESKGKVYEIDTTNRDVEDIVNEIIEAIKHKKERKGIVNWTEDYFDYLTLEIK